MLTGLPTLTLEALAGCPPEATLVLTVNNRLARRLMMQWPKQFAVGQRVAAIPDVLPISAWVRNLGEQRAFESSLSLPAVALDAFATQWVWHDVIEQQEADHPLLDMGAAARLAADADALMHSWQVTVLPAESTPDHERFTLWRQAYEQRLRQLDAEDEPRVWEAVRQALESGGLPVPERVVLVGFSELAPRQQALLAAVQLRGAHCSRLVWAQQACTEPRRVQAGDPDQEWRLAAQWAAERLASRPSGCYAIVAPQLAAQVPLAHRVVSEALEPLEESYNVAVGRPLSEWPLPYAGQAWLAVAVALGRPGGRMAVADAAAALLAGACTGELEEAGGRAALDVRWRRDACLEIRAGDWAEGLSAYAPQLRRAWDDCVALMADAQPALPSVWSARFRQWLQLLGFPGDSALDSAAYQSMEAFDGLLESQDMLDAVTGPLTAGAALALLRQRATQTLFQPQRDPRARLDVLGLLEAEGGQWDGVWLLGLTDDLLPAAARPNPFLPLSSLRRAGAPRATPERELQWAQNMLAAMQATAPEIWTSHAARDGERLLRPSPLIAAWPEQIQHWIAPPVAGCVLETVADDYGPVLGEGPVRGGVGLLDTQARNPLWAFAKYRLGLSALPDYTTLPDTRLRGLFLHRAVQLWWRQVPDQARLQVLVADGGWQPLLQEILSLAADQELLGYGPTLRRLELMRAEEILGSWLIQESEREPFMVEGLEAPAEGVVGGLTLALRLDRVDRLEDGRLVLIDYKSGELTDPRADWLRPRPVNLQLPLYAVTSEAAGAEVAALALVRLHAAGVETKGVADNGLAGLPAPTDWTDGEWGWPRLLDHWREALDVLAREYKAGVARNDFERQADLQYCDVLPFLRLNEGREEGAILQNAQVEERDD